MARKKNSSTAMVVFALLLIVWVAEVFFFCENLESAEEKRTAMAEQEKALTVQYEAQKREAEQLRKYIEKMLSDREFIEREARERLGAGLDGEIVIRGDKN